MNRPDAVWSVILAGGDGTRLQPLTRLITGEDRPKQFCRLYGTQTLLTNTRFRLAPAIAPERTMFVVVKAHERFYQTELADVPPSRLVVQPSNRGTTAAIVASLLRLAGLAGDPIVAFFPVDHHYSKEIRFVASVRLALDVVRDSPDRLMILGTGAQHPEVEYGWIEPGGMLRCHLTNSVFQVRRFWEKPSKDVAQELHARGCLWNTFVMIGRVSAFLQMVAASVPRVLRAFRAASVSAPSSKFDLERAEELYASLVPSDFSRQVLSVCAEKLAVLRLDDVGWSDLGTPERVFSAIEAAGLCVSMAGTRPE